MKGQDMSRNVTPSPTDSLETLSEAALTTEVLSRAIDNDINAVVYVSKSTALSTRIKLSLYRRALEKDVAAACLALRDDPILKNRAFLTWVKENYPSAEDSVDFPRWSLQGDKPRGTRVHSGADPSVMNGNDWEQGELQPLLDEPLDGVRPVDTPYAVEELLALMYRLAQLIETSPDSIEDIREKEADIHGYCSKADVSPDAILLAFKIYGVEFIMEQYGFMFTKDIDIDYLFAPVKAGVDCWWNRVKYQSTVQESTDQGRYTSTQVNYAREFLRVYGGTGVWLLFPQLYTLDGSFIGTATENNEELTVLQNPRVQHAVGVHSVCMMYQGRHAASTPSHYGGVDVPLLPGNKMITAAKDMIQWLGGKASTDVIMKILATAYIESPMSRTPVVTEAAWMLTKLWMNRVHSDTLSWIRPKRPSGVDTSGYVSVNGDEYVDDDEYPPDTDTVLDVVRHLEPATVDTVTEEAYINLVATCQKMLTQIDRKYRTYNVCYAGVKVDGTALHAVPEDYRDAALCKVAVSNDGNALMFVPPPLRTRDLCNIAVSKDGTAINSVPHGLWTHDLCMKAVEQTPHVLIWILYAIQNNDDTFQSRCLGTDVQRNQLYMKSVERYEQSLCHINVDHWTFMLCETAIFGDPSILKRVIKKWPRVSFSVGTEKDEHLKTLCTLAVFKDPRMVKYVPNDLVEDQWSDRSHTPLVTVGTPGESLDTSTLAEKRGHLIVSTLLAIHRGSFDPSSVSSETALAHVRVAPLLYVYYENCFTTDDKKVAHEMYQTYCRDELAIKV